MSDKKRVFLGGTCNNSTWRNELIPMLEIGFYNPVVEDWTPECMAEERKQRETCDYCLYVITPKMTGVYSIAEAVDDSNKRPERTLFCILRDDSDQKFTDSQWKSLGQVSELIGRNGGTQFSDLRDVAKYLNGTWKDRLMWGRQPTSISKQQTEPLEPISPLAMHSLASHGAFALMYLQKDRDDKRTLLLADGIEFCERLQKSGVEEPKDAKWTAETVRRRLALYESKKYDITDDDIQDIHELLDFFNNRSDPFLMEAQKMSLRRRGRCF